MDVAMREDLVAAGMEPAQAEVLVSHMPDWSQLATKADLPDWSQFATKADLKDLEQKFQAQMLDLQRQMVEMQGQMVSLETNLQGQITDMKSSLNWRLWLPVATAIGAVILSYLLP